MTQGFFVVYLVIYELAPFFGANPREGACWVTKLYLFYATAQSNVKGDDGLGTVVHVGYFVELCAKQALLSGEHLKIIGLTIVHQLVSSYVGIMEHLYLTMVILMLVA